MKSIYYVLFLALLFAACNTSKNTATSKEDNNIKANDTISISNTELEYEVIIIEPGFSAWLASKAKPKGYHSKNFLESKNAQYVSVWNARALNPTKYNSKLYEMQIDYKPNIDYGYEVNYKLYNYFVYFQLKYKQQLLGIVPRF
ncbi:MAG: DUF6146 family protein [Oceanihabitans sp.]